jgi:hypothetical protein
MSANERPDLRAFRELETLVRHLGEELAAFRRRALAAEAQLKVGGHAPTQKGGGGGRGASGAKGGDTGLEAENEALRTRVTRAEDRVRQMMDRVRFLRQQIQSQAGTTAGRP